MIKKFLLFLLGFVFVMLGWAFISPKEFSVVREITINRPNAEVFGYIRFLKNQEKFSAWAKMDPQMKRGFTGKDGEVGAIASWDGNKQVGIGEQEIKKITPNHRMDLELRFKKPFETTSTAFMSTEAIGPNQTRVQWGFAGKMPVPMNLMLTFGNMDEMGGKDLATGLANLKSVLEER
ncbi:MAG: SRPBCC family protein [Spirochaetia bacterium]|nr:SRPBCC family protein [Spirochaetia bacterium]